MREVVFGGCVFGGCCGVVGDVLGFGVRLWRWEFVKLGLVSAHCTRTDRRQGSGSGDPSELSIVLL